MYCIQASTIYTSLAFHSLELFIFLLGQSNLAKTLRSNLCMVEYQTISYEGCTLNKICSKSYKLQTAKNVN